MTQFIKNKAVRITYNVLRGIFAILLTVYVMLQLSVVQTWIIQKITNDFNKKYPFTISIEQVSISWFDEIEIEGARLNDPEKNTMFSIDKLLVDFNILSVIVGSDNLYYDLLVIEGPKVYLTQIVSPDSTITLNINYLQRLLRRPATTGEGGIPCIYVDEVFIKDGKFQYENQYGKILYEGFDPNHFIFSKIGLHAKDFLLEKGNIHMNILALTTYEKNTDLALSPLKSKLSLYPNKISLVDLDLKIGNSKIKDSLVFDFKNFYQFNYIWDSVKISANLNESIIYGKDIRAFLPWAQRLPDSVLISGNFEGLLSDFYMSDLDIRFGNSTNLLGNLSMNGLPYTNETSMILDLKNSSVSFQDLESITQLRNDQLRKLGTMKMKGRFGGFFNDFVAVGEFESRIGKIGSSINLKLSEDEPPGYSGELLLTNFNLASFTDNEDLGMINFSGNIEGKGFNQSSAQVKVDGNILNIDFKKYKYQNIYANGKFADQYFEGILTVDDPNLTFDMTGTVDLRKGNEHLNLKANLDTVNLKTLNLYPSDFWLFANGQMDIDGLDLDQFTGTGSLNEVYFKTQSNSLSLDSVKFSAGFDNEFRNISISSLPANFTLTGNYKLTTLYDEIEELVKQYISIIKNHGEISPENIQYHKSPTFNNANFELRLNSISSLLQVFIPDLNMADGTLIQGNYQGGTNKIINIYTESDSIIYKNNRLSSNRLELNSSIAPDGEVLAMVFAESGKQDFGGVKSENLILEGIWDARHIDFEFNMEQPTFKNLFHFIGNVDFRLDSTVISLDKSDLELLGNNWEVSKMGQVIFSGDDITFNDIKAESPGQGFSIDGIISKDPTQLLKVNFDSLRLENFNSLINKEISGRLDGQLSISDVFVNASLENDLTISDFRVNDFKVGDVAGSMLWNRTESRFDVNCLITYDKIPTMRLSGYYTPKEENNSLRLEATLVDAQINILEPFIGGYFSKLSGTATGGFTITGTPLSPKIKGLGRLKKGELTINYLNTTYQAAGLFSFSENLIFLNEIAIRDKSGGKGRITGVIDHGGFTNMKVDLDGSFEKLQVLNTSAGDNSLFYGQGIGTGDISFRGPVSKLTIETNVKTDKGTRIFIPIEGTEFSETSEYISFVDFSDTLKTEETETNRVKVSGIILDMNIEVTPDAYCEIIFDIKAGDIIRGRGTGDLSLRIDTNGEFSMFGPLTINQGWYNFTLYNLINKEFNVLPGGTINWFGDPYGGIMDLKASYNQNASLEPILPVEFVGAPELGRKYPVTVDMDLKGPLLNPEITFDIQALNLPRNVVLTGGDASGTALDLDFEFQSFKNKIDEQELKRQVFSLIVLRKFSPPESFNTGGAITNSVSELFSNQLSYWMSQVDSNLDIDIDVDLSSFDEEAFNTFQLRLSYAFLNGRLRVTRDGNFTDNQSNVSVTSLAGNWSVEYLLTPDGRVKVRMYNRNNFDNVTVPDRTNTNTTGFSLQYTKSFDEFLKEMGKIFRKEDQDGQKSNNDDEESSANKEAILERRDYEN